MIELFIVVFFFWLFWQVLRLSLHMAWSAARVFGTLLAALALPLLICLLLFAGGVLLLIPVAVVAIAWGILKVCL